MSDQKLITIKAKSKTGQIVEFHVQEILEIDGSSRAQFESAVRLEQFEERLTALETAVYGESDA